LAAADGEKMEWGTLYPNFEKVARKEDLMILLEVLKKLQK